MNVAESIIKPLRPQRHKKGWKYVGEYLEYDYPAESWYFPERGIAVISAVELVEKEIGAEYHVSISKPPGRCTSNEAKFVLRCFGMDGAEEDNHGGPGLRARHFWRPVNENLIGMECKCKKTENAIVEDKGDYVWRTGGDKHD